MKKVLLVGESWISYTTHIKGFDTFYTATYASGERFLADAMKHGGYDFTFMPNHEAMHDFPYSLEGLQEYDVIILSDIGANTLLLPDRVFTRSEASPNRCNLLEQYVLEGGALLMVGGYMTFAGIDGKGKWHDTAVQNVLPVEVLTVDDRMEHPEGITPVTLDPKHPIFDGVSLDWPFVLGYNKTIMRDGYDLLAKIGEDPFIAVGEFGKGRSAVVTTDCSPHWAPPEFCSWESYEKLWQNIVAWLLA